MSTANFYAIYRRKNRCYVEAGSGEYVTAHEATRFSTRAEAARVSKRSPHADNCEVHHIQVTTDVLEKWPA